MQTSKGMGLRQREHLLVVAAVILVGAALGVWLSSWWLMLSVAGALALCGMALSNVDEPEQQPKLD